MGTHAAVADTGVDIPVVVDSPVLVDTEVDSVVAGIPDSQVGTDSHFPSSRNSMEVDQEEERKWESCSVLLRREGEPRYF